MTATAISRGRKDDERNPTRYATDKRAERRNPHGNSGLALLCHWIPIPARRDGTYTAGRVDHDRRKGIAVSCCRMNGSEKNNRGSGRHAKGEGQHECYAKQGS
ncbi:MAG TPA: hypothetical protein VGA01_12330 [Candidatus Binatia bacterium]